MSTYSKLLAPIAGTMIGSSVANAGDLVDLNAFPIAGGGAQMEIENFTNETISTGLYAEGGARVPLLIGNESLAIGAEARAVLTGDINHYNKRKDGDDFGANLSASASAGPLVKIANKVEIGAGHGIQLPVFSTFGKTGFEQVQTGPYAEFRYGKNYPAGFRVETFTDPSLNLTVKGGFTGTF